MKGLIVGDSLGQKLAKKINWDFIPLEERIFPDAELQPKLEKEKKRDKIIFILQKRNRENINSYLVKYFLLSRKLKDLAKKVIGIMPYFPYARQDSVFREGEPLSALYIAELIEKNLDVFITCNMHEHRKKIGDLFKIPAYNIFLFEYLAKHFKNFNPKNSLVIGPDKEAETFVKNFRRGFPAKMAILKKERDLKTGKIKFLSTEELKPIIKNKEIIIVDDMVSTAGTITEAAKIVSKMKPKSISFAFVHPVFGNKSINALKKLKPKKIVCTNTIENNQYKTDISDCLKNFFINFNF